MNASTKGLEVHMLPQPDDNTCGPTSLHAVYNYHNLELSLKEVIKGIDRVGNGGTLAVYLGVDALKRGFDATIYTFNLRMFDPTWFVLSSEQIRDKIRARLKHKRIKKLKDMGDAYMEFLALGGEIRMEDLTTALIQSFLDEGNPILTGLSATYLYHSQREYADDQGASVYDDLKGEPMGHFVVLMGRSDNGDILVADPYKGNPISSNNYYKVAPTRLIHSILLGIVTYDANLLIISPK
ncbi:MAG: hypothetical protein RLP15_11390 [Cryomorphaceae bacterium]